MTALWWRTINCIGCRKSLHVYCLHRTALALWCGEDTLMSLMASVLVASQDTFKDCWPFRDLQIAGNGCIDCATPERLLCTGLRSESPSAESSKLYTTFCTLHSVHNRISQTVCFRDFCQCRSSW